MEEYKGLLLKKINYIIQKYADKTAYIIDKEHVTYRKMNDMAERIASAIATELGNPDTGDRPVRIGINLSRSDHYVPCILAAVKLGCAYVPIDYTVPEERKAFICNDCQLDFLITKDNLPTLIQSEISMLPDYSRSTSEAYLIYTSGTTGTPKGVSQTYRTLYNFMETISMPDSYNISDKSVILNFASINFDVSVLEIFAPIYYGATLVIAQDEERHNAKKLHDMMIREHITFCFLPPSLMAVFPDYNFPDMDTLSAGGEAIPYSLTQKIAGKQPYRFVNGYGPTESFYTTTHVIENEDDWKNIGRPVPGVVCYVADEDGRLVSPGERGELLIAGMQLANGYWNRPELNEKLFFDNPYEKIHDGIDVSRLYHSGDLVTLNSDGSFDYIGRMDSQIKLHGFRIELDEIISRLEMHDSIARAFVRLEEAGNDKALVAYVCLTSQYRDNPNALDDLKRYASEHLQPYMVPTFWNIVDQFALNINGKIDKVQLKNTALERLMTNTSRLTESEYLLMKSIANVMHYKRINADADLISELGLSSIQIMEVISSLTTIGIYLQEHDFFEYRSIRKIIANHHDADSYWYNDDDTTTKPVIICIAGFTGFWYMYNQAMDKLTDKFSIFVLESYHNIIGKERLATMDELMGMYKERIQHIVDNHETAFFTGMCYGGEQALYLAHCLYKDKEHKPIVVCLDGEVDRDNDRAKNPTIYFPFFSKAYNQHRSDQDFLLVETTPDFLYQGKIASMVCSEFIDCYSYLDPNPSEYKIECIKEFLRTAPTRWKRRYPDCQLIMFPTHHDAFWRSEPSLTMIQECFYNLYNDSKSNNK